MRAAAAIPLGAVALLTAAGLAAASFAMVGMSSPEPEPNGASSCSVSTAGVSVEASSVSAEQEANASTIIGVGKGLGVPVRGWVVALAAAMQESGLRNLSYGDRDSLGLFQQRPSSGWGSPAQVQDPTYAAQAFYRGVDTGAGHIPGLLDVPGWEAMPVTVAAQRVQRSAYPTAYARHEARAATMVTALGGAAAVVSAVNPAFCRPLAAGPWALPLAVPYRLSSAFGSRMDPIRRRVSFHTGQDFAAPTGSAVLAVSSGSVVSAQRAGGYGLLVRVQHVDGVQSWYAHLSEIAVTPGTSVEPGTVLGAVGSTGNSTGPHLHLEIRLNDAPVEPMGWLREHREP